MAYVGFGETYVRLNDRKWPVSDFAHLAPTVICPRPLHVRLLGDLQRVVDLDPEVADGAFELGVAEQ